MIVYKPTCTQTRYRNRGVTIQRVARPQLPITVPAPALDYVVGREGAGVVTSWGYGDNSWSGDKG
jgi:hypothetical protein